MLTRLELIGILVIVAVVVLVIGWLAWGLLRPSRVPERAIWDLEIAPHGGEQYPGPPVVTVAKAPTDNPELIGLYNIVGGRPPQTPILARSTREAFAWPSRAPYGASACTDGSVRESFRLFLAGGPDYRG